MAFGYDNVPAQGIDGVGKVFQFPIAAPAPGVGGQFVVGENFAFEPLTILFLFTASAAVANRIASLIVTSPAGIMWRHFDFVAITANQAITVAFGQGFGALNNAGNTHGIMLPRFIAPPGTTFDVSANLIDAADQLSAILFSGLVYPLA